MPFAKCTSAGMAGKGNVNHSVQPIGTNGMDWNRRMRWLRFFVLLVLIPLTGCAGSIQPVSYNAEPRQGPYLLDTGDVLRVSVYGDTELTGLYQVDDSGSIALPLVGPIPAKGVTTSIAAARIAAALAAGYMRNPNVAVEIATYRPFFIQGEVGKSGQYPYVFGMTLRSAIATAGGYTDTADRTGASLYRQNGNRVVQSWVSLDFAIRPGDTIVINERWL
jgi:polysaccharide biosynthesis/export protein